MIDPYLILAGFGIGFVLAAPVGPVNILCIQRTLSRGFWGGIAVGIGAVLGDGLLALAAASGMAVVAGFIKMFAAQIQLVGGMILKLFGIKLFRTNARAANGQDPRPSYETSTCLRSNGRVIPQTFFLNVTNPGAMLGTFALFGGLSSAFGSFSSHIDVIAVVVAVMAGNLLWWIGLSSVISVIRHRLGYEQLQMINRVAGIALIGFGFVLVVRGAMTVNF